MEQLLNSFNALKRAINLHQKRYNSAELDEQEAYTASVIKHFELCYEMVWKFFKLYLFEKFGTDVTDSKTVFRACCDHKIITTQELSILLKLVEARNLTTYTYDEEAAHQICQEIFIYTPTLEILIKNAQK